MHIINIELGSEKFKKIFVIDYETYVINESIIDLCKDINVSPYVRIKYKQHYPETDQGLKTYVKKLLNEWRTPGNRYNNEIVSAELLFNNATDHNLFKLSME